MILKTDDSAWLTQKLPKFKHGTSRVQLLFKGSDNGDGWDVSDFHRKCDNQGATLTVMKSSAGKVFGGFASISWQSISGGDWGRDEESFIYSMDLKTTYRPTDYDMALYLDKDYGPSFGGDSLLLGFGKMNN